ncbi:dihydroxyacetone kinase subunit L [Cetobacterium sp. 2G large]|uniref:dihydroxyacetone kinase subunit L n=1 Tax=Cetobacterium sp. 2G large TaxID=2759680 RepID=UPI00163CD56F|nr:dihydroxyacetone kinase subunit L [Cetobacterium sp. 2G large]MBC2853619.1 dihydroxyacetone kinase subunit L [Cetobacterium sp. 2G large]
MVITKERWISIFQNISELMIENKEILSDIDSKFGDGDHGITIERIGMVIKDKSQEWKEKNQSLKGFFQEIGDAVTNINGGSAGPLYGTYLSGLGEDLDEDIINVDGKTLKKILSSGLTELQYLTTAKVGDKTMMDTLIPATEAALNASDNVLDIVTKAKDAALEGAEKSKDFISKFGRAKSYKEKTIGTPDAGATSCTYIFLGLYNSCK